LGSQPKKVKQLIPGKPVLGPKQLMGADGAYHQEWKYAEAGITLEMVSEKKGGPKSIASISVSGVLSIWLWHFMPTFQS
jgi:hypothetical protein